MGVSLEALARETPKQRLVRRLKKAGWNVLFALTAYAVIVLGARLLHRRVLYQPPGEDEAQLPEGAGLLTARAADGVPSTPSSGAIRRRRARSCTSMATRRLSLRTPSSPAS